ncbi:MAG: isoprenyl transferase [Deltaproteobacteria bacterium]|nr:isoprenyl transferase [Deltaproteobacteria bacterium]
MHRSLPQHIAIILDGNGRWAKNRNLPRIQGHVIGAQRVKEIVTYCAKIGLPALTLFAFSTENWRRSKTEVAFLMRLLRRYIRGERENILNNNIVLRILGNQQSLPPIVADELADIVHVSQKNSGMKLNFALAYGGRDEIIRAARKLASSCQEGSLTPAGINEETFAEALDTVELPDPDLLIRTSGEKRISNFLLWQMAYTEMYYTDTLWPDFSVDHLEKAIEDFFRRDRRFGKVGEDFDGK